MPETQIPNTSLGDALSIFDLETMLCSAERPPRENEAKAELLSSRVPLSFYANKHSYPIDPITVDRFPPRALHPRFKQRVKAAEKVTGRVGGNDRVKKIMREIKEMVVTPHKNIDLYVVDGDMSFLKAVIEAPNGIDCPYSGGTFLVTCNLPAGYPRDAPEVRFVTTIMHPNVSKQGKVYGILLTPDLENPLEVQTSLKYYEDDGSYAMAVAEATKRHASKNRAQWKEELDG
ncbi:ubiquitin-conjugating enzyme/RWD-like protein [Roridomyces roridus]|uniref:Ubiquitin-conjugating enzyme/RWD-like protein n=1 Tax=Roridomyces roridus TaxID=1738132 RepID=A0AAD7FT14_9AGAR|nr:ubiquitin-conjugating enzyme/RWD-like protein [Roridomyces roridus]